MFKIGIKMGILFYRVILVFLSIVSVISSRTYIVDKEGKKEIIEQKNGIVITVLLEPSTTYIETIIKPAQEQYLKELQQQQYELLISSTIRQNVINQLKSEGKLPMDYK